MAPRRKMLITLCYIYLWLRFQRYYTSAIRSALHRLTGQSSFTFCALRAAPRRDEALFLRRGDRVLYITEPQACEDLSKWTLLGSSLVCGQRLESIAFIIEATSRQKVPVSLHRTNEKVLNWSDYCLPLAYRPGQPYRAVAETSLENFSRLGVAFLEDRLLMEDGLVPEKIVSVSLGETALEGLFEQDASKRIEAESRDSPELCRRSSLHQPELLSEHQHLHLSSCHECLELENSTILSVKFASAENIPDLPDDYTAAGTDDEEEEEEEEQRRRSGGKPPNLLVFTGGCEQRFQEIRSLLQNCVDTDTCAVYHLSPRQALSEPWLDNTLLLVLATDETLAPDLQLRFLSFLSRGGRLLGLSCSLCPAGLSLRPSQAPADRVCSLSFTRADCSELQLSVLSSGSVNERDGAGGGQVELWGQTGAQEMAIVRVTHGDDSGEAVLCQVRLETSPDAEGSAGSSELKRSDARRYEVLTEILTSLGVCCELRPLPEPSPVYLLHTHTAGWFLLWLRAQTLVSGGVLRSGAGALRVVWSGEAPLGVCEGERVLVTEPPQSFSEHFCLQTYTQHLQTQRLGRTVLYADVTCSTTSLLNGLMPPQEVGLIAIAARQTQGKGRGGNAWLSPLGCAMFTLHLQLPVTSRLGQRIPFLQHLAALAVVESVRTLPGYQDVDLRLKWPNDIYYSNLLKLGGVLVNSSVTGQTFSLLIGCGFNVSNSSPTVCINDLLRQHRLDPLTPAQLIARSVTLLERYVSEFQLRGPQALLTLYYSRWVHGGTRVRLWSEDGPEAEVLGLDENGFLQVRAGDGSVVSVQPDGNSFDMLRNLVVTKTS
ncbi:biotin--protein ligase isoform X2 [Puntigrus tetrazona]|uniref:biotin--protein ligase isoform X2 n=1 Tax=Puntigrus tetrazona TaxID=1606681 RepID=UPI001C895201|nr:biotin--protein ligase isoform X2 [Puntigrus tetrazona]